MPHDRYYATPAGKPTKEWVACVFDKRNGNCVAACHTIEDAERQAKRLNMTKSERALELIEQISRMTQDGEDMDGEEFEMSGDDACATVNNLIDEARKIQALED